MKRYCFYHAGCPDGFAAAFSVWKAFGSDARYIARGHDDEPFDPMELEDAAAIFVDIAPTNEELRSLSPCVDKLTVLDHHVSARDRYQSDEAAVQEVQDKGHEIVFDLHHSGAILAWNHFFDDLEAPMLLRYVEDQDLWNWKLPNSEEVNAALASYPRRFDTWAELIERKIEDLASEGESIVRSNKMQVERSLGHSHMIRIDEQRIEAVNATENRSAIGHALAGSARFDRQWGCVYRLNLDRVSATLYSIGDVDVSGIAASYGGGGHRNAAGFSVSLKTWVADFL